MDANWRNRNSRWKLAIIIWTVGSILLQLLVRALSSTYDSSGIVGALWWLAQAIILPVSLLSEALRSVGIPASGFVSYLLLTAVIGLSALLIVSCRKQPNPNPDGEAN